jgi:hypothetical protein
VLPHRARPRRVARTAICEKRRSLAFATRARHDEARCKTLRDLIQKGTFGFGVFDTADVRKTYEELKARGVQFIQEPTERPYGIEALMKDDSGNWFSLSQHR